MKSFTDFVVGERYKCLTKGYVCLFSSQDGVLMKSDDGSTTAVASPDRWEEVPPPPPPPKKMKTFYRPFFESVDDLVYSSSFLFDTRLDAAAYAKNHADLTIGIEEVQVEVFDA